MNLVNTNTPYGSTSFDPTGSYTNPEGQTVPRYTENVTLSPANQAILTGQQNVAQTLIPTTENLAGQAASATAKPLDFSGVNQDILSQGPNLLDQNTTNAIYNQQKSFLDPQWDLQSKKLEDQLARQGIPVGSEAYNSSLDQLSNARTQAYQSAQDTAIGQGVSNAQGLFGLAQAGQNQNIQQQQIAQQQPISLLSQWYGATPATPQQPIASPSQTSVAPTDVVGATAAANNAAMQAYQAQIGQSNSNTGAITGLIAAAGTAAAIY